MVNTKAYIYVLIIGTYLHYQIYTQNYTKQHSVQNMFLNKVNNNNNVSKQGKQYTAFRTCFFLAMSNYNSDLHVVCVENDWSNNVIV